MSEAKYLTPYEYYFLFRREDFTSSRSITLPVQPLFQGLETDFTHSGSQRVNKLVEVPYTAITTPESSEIFSNYLTSLRRVIEDTESARLLADLSLYRLMLVNPGNPLNSSFALFAKESVVIRNLGLREPAEIKHMGVYFRKTAMQHLIDGKFDLYCGS